MNPTRNTNKQEDKTVKNVSVLVGKSVQNILLADRHQAIVNLAATGTRRQSEVERYEENQD